LFPRAAYKTRFATVEIKLTKVDSEAIMRYTIKGMGHALLYVVNKSMNIAARVIGLVSASVGL